MLFNEFEKIIPVKRSFVIEFYFDIAIRSFNKDNAGGILSGAM